MQKLEELIAALEKATGPDRWCDANIHVMAHGQTIEIFGGNIVSNGHCVIGWLDPGKVNVNFTTSGIGEKIPRYTASIDAAVALVERVLPGWTWDIGGCPEDFLTDKDKPFNAALMGPVSYAVIDREVGEEPVYDTAHASAPTAPLAICLAALLALQEQRK